MKIKEVCTKTGLTEKAVRYYVENGLCSPEEYESRGRKYLTFTERNVEELRDAALLRKLGLSIDDIRAMKQDGGQIGEVMGRYMRGLSEELEQKRRIFSSLSSVDYSAPRTLSELVPTLSEALRPDPAAPDFSKFEKEPFDDGKEAEMPDYESPKSRLVKIEVIFITYATVIGTLMAVTSLPGIIMLVIAAILSIKIRADYMSMYIILSGIGFLANAISFVRSAAGLGGALRFMWIFTASMPDFAVMRCRLYFIIAAAELISLLILIFGRKIREHF